MLDGHTERVIEKVLVYDPLTFASAGLEDAPLGTWLNANPNAWRADRVSDLDAPETQQGALLLVGEEGCGKTTEIRRICSAIERRRGYHAYLLDFSHAAAVFNADLPRVDRAIASNIIDQVDRIVRDADLVVTFRAALYRRVLKDAAHACLRAAKDKYGKVLDHIPDNELIGTSEIVDAVGTYESQCGALDLAQHHLWALQMFSERTTFLVDNLDHLGVDRLQKAVRLFSTSIFGNTQLIVALRSENAPAAIKDLSHLRGVVTERLDSDGAIWPIATTRINGAQRYLIELAGKTESPPDALLSSIVEEQLIKVQLLRDHPGVRTLIEQWYNGNVRQMLPAVRWLVANNPLGSPASTVYGRAHGHLISDQAHPSLYRILDPRPVQHTHNPFVFLRLRILSYLDKQDGGGKSVRTLQDEFREAFGVPNSAIGRALEALAERSGTGGALVRLTAHHDNSLGGGLGNAYLLPAGRCFVNQIVFTCDFLAWIYDQRGYAGTADAVRGEGAAVKLEKALVVVERVLLRAFIKEHPYIEGDYRATADDHARLGAYINMFDYGVDQWFILKLQIELRSYADERDLKSRRLGRVMGRIGAMVDKLNAMAESPYIAD